MEKTRSNGQGASRDVPALYKVVDKRDLNQSRKLSYKGLGAREPRSDGDASHIYMFFMTLIVLERVTGSPSHPH